MQWDAILKIFLYIGVMPVRRTKSKPKSRAKPRRRKSSPKPRNYKQEYKYHGTPKQKKRRAQRNSARRKMVKAGRARKGDGKDVDHKNRNTADNRPKNLRVISKRKNRSYKRK